MKICDRCNKKTDKLSYLYNERGDFITGGQELCPECFKEYKELIDNFESVLRPEISKRRETIIKDWLDNIKGVPK